MNKEIIKKARKMRLRSRLLVGCIVLPVLLLLCMFVAYYYFSKEDILSKTIQSSTKVVSIVEEIFSLNASWIEHQLDEVIEDPLVNSIVLGLNHTDYEENNTQVLKFKTYLSSKKSLYDNAKEVALYSANMMQMYSMSDKLDHKEVESYLEQASTNPKQSLWFHTKNGSEGLVVLVKPVCNDNSTIIGYALVGLEEKAFSSAFATLDSKEDSIVILNEANEYLFGTGTNLSYQQKIEVVDNATKINTTDYIAVTKKAKTSTWNVVDLISEDYVIEQLNSVKKLLVVFSTILILWMLIATRVLYLSLIGPLNEIIRCLNLVIEGNLNIRIEDDGDDEIHELAIQYNSLIDWLANLLEVVENEQGKKREAEIKMLQAQINPHFLFNTLNTLKGVALMNDDRPVAKGLQALAKLLRNTIVNSDELVEIQEEIENLNNYIIIQKLRYGNGFEIKYNVEEETKHYKIMKFILQPIVENAILHAFEEDKDGQVIEVNIFIENEYVVIVIEDNGIGYDTKQKDSETKGNLSGIGMKNVEERIRLTFSANYKMYTESKIGQGTKVTIKLPIVDQ
ncbi:MAG: sensor histidine kinase [Erysipelotrichaceae bacterium]